MDIVKDIISPFYTNPFPYKVSPGTWKDKNPYEIPNEGTETGEDQHSWL